MKSLGPILLLITLTYMASVCKVVSVHDAIWVNVLGCMAMIPSLSRAPLDHRRMLRQARAR